MSTTRIVVSYICIWILAAVINAILIGLILCHGEKINVEGFAVLFFCSLVFAIPILFAAVIITLVVDALKIISNAFVMVLLISFITAAVGAFLYSSLLYEIDHEAFRLGVCIVIASLGAVCICYKLIRPPKNEELIAAIEDIAVE